MTFIHSFIEAERRATAIEFMAWLAKRGVRFCDDLGDVLPPRRLLRETERFAKGER